MVVQVVTEAPTRPARLGGIKRVAEIRTADRIGASEQITYISQGCTLPQPAIGLCYGTPVVTPKTSVGLANINAAIPAFVQYGGVQCFISPDSDFPARARRILEDGEDRGIESRIATWANTNGFALAGGTIAVAIGQVEQDMDAKYMGQGYILMSRADAVKAAASSALEPGLDGPYTINGTPIVASGAVTSGTIYGIGATTILKSSVVDIDTVNVTTNKNWAVAEAVYAVLIDCNYASKAAAT